MADVSADTPIFSRGSTVLDYWLVHAKGLTVQPLGARVEEVVVTAPIGRAESLIVRSRRTRRLREIPAASIVAVEPSSGNLLLDESESENRAGLHIPRPSPERIAAARASSGRGIRLVQTQTAGAARLTNAGTRSALSWLRPRVALAVATTARHSRVAARQTARGVAWLAPRIAARIRIALTTGARWTLAAAVIIARATVRTASELGRATATGVERGRVSLEARRARRLEASRAAELVVRPRVEREVEQQDDE
jgi:hypothetical protein